MIDEADRDGDGEISEEDFIRVMKKTNLFWSVRINIIKIIYLNKFNSLYQYIII
jgi:hypothetical protein